MAMKPAALVTVEDAGKAIGLSRSTVWRMIRAGTLPSVRQGGRRLVPRDALEARNTARRSDEVPPLDRSNPIFRLVGAGRSGGKPGARDKHAILDER